jgi:gamma-glutamylcyclotransferase (GGCT)/AIG2-like uncharacterized protein YtfP
MFNLGTYPGLTEVSSGGLSIQGEVWEVSHDTLQELDDIESTGEGLYARVPIGLTTCRFGVVEAYLYLQSTDDCPDCGELWELGA